MSFSLDWLGIPHWSWAQWGIFAGKAALACLVVYGLWWALTYALGWRTRKPPFRESPMRFRVGRPGSGKTLMSIKEAILAMRDGVPVYSNLPIVDPVSGRRGGLVSGWAHLMSMTEDRDKGGLQLRNFMVLVDEGNVWACSRLSKLIPIWLLSWWAQRRHYGAEIHITAQHENRVDVVLRETVDKIDVCERVRWIPKFVPLFRLTPCYPEELEALRGGQAQRTELHRVPWWVYFGYSTVHNVQPVDLKAEQAPTVEHETITHPNYLPGVRWDGRKIPKRLFWSFVKEWKHDRWWDKWTEFLDTPEGALWSPPPVENDHFEAWVVSDEGRESIRLLNP